MPTIETVRKALAAIKRKADYDYFFSQLQSPKWIRPLWDAGMFQTPPGPVRKDQYISFPFWAESQYLVRMAPQKPETVLDVILQIPDTDNIRVHEDLADAALAMPAELAAHWANKEAEWIETQEVLHSFLPEKIGDLIEHIAKGGQVQEALHLANTLLAILPAQDQEGEEKEAEYRGLHRERTRFDIWDYGQILEKNIPALVSVAKTETFELLCELLNSTINCSESQRRNQDRRDYSYIWRPAIEDHEQNSAAPYRLRDLLVTAVRNTAIQIATNPTQIPTLVEKLERRPWFIFSRIALHLLRVCADAPLELITERLTDRDRFDEIHLWHEYAILGRDHFARLSPDAQQTILAWIEEGPDLEDYRTWYKEYHEQDPAADDIQKYATRQRLRWLAPLHEVLPDDWKGRYDTWAGEVGEPEHPEFVSYSSGGFIGPTSPKSSEDISNLRIDEIVTFLKNWQPSLDEMTEPSPEGFGRELTASVASNPERFAQDALRFQRLDPTYVRSLLSGLQEAAKAKQGFPWQPVLDLCQWVVQQPREIPGRTDRYTHIDPGWVWTRKRIASLLSAGFSSDAGPAEISFTLRSVTWNILDPITHDADPEKDAGGDPATQSINTTRGEAMHTVVHYALWVRQNLEKSPDGKARLERGFEEMPEVREVLEAHLDPTKDPAVAIRSVYGQWFPWLALLDRNWAEEHIPTIFPSDETLHHLRDAAWETYVIFCRPYDDPFEMLQEEYRRAIARLGEDNTKWRNTYNAEEHLADHLMTFYWRGKISLDDPESLLVQFYEKASDKVCFHAMDFIGRILQDAVISEEILNRLMSFWEYRLAGIKASDSPSSHESEIAAFGWWFVSGKFEDDWALNQLTEVLRMVGTVDLVDREVVERLADLTSLRPKQVVTCLRFMVEGAKESWRIQGWGNYPRKILQTAIKNPDHEVRQAAVDLINFLGACGYFEFRELLPEEA